MFSEETGVKILDLVREYGEQHDLAVTCGSEYIAQSDSARVDAQELVEKIFNLVSLEHEDDAFEDD